MLSNERAKLPWRQHPIYKYGVLMVLAVIAAFHAWVLMTGVQYSTRFSAQMGLTSILMLSASHVSTSFLTPPQQRRFLPFLGTFVAVGLGYVLMLFWQKYFQA